MQLGPKCVLKYSSKEDGVWYPPGPSIKSLRWQGGTLPRYWQSKECISPFRTSQLLRTAAAASSSGFDCLDGTTKHLAAEHVRRQAYRLKMCDQTTDESISDPNRSLTAVGKPTGWYAPFQLPRLLVEHERCLLAVEVSVRLEGKQCTTPKKSRRPKIEPPGRCRTFTPCFFRFRSFATRPCQASK